MKKKSKRILATALSAVMLMATVSGCGAKPATSESTQSAVPSQAQAEKLTVWLAPCGNKDLPDQDFWDEALKSFEEENNVDIAVEIVPWANYEEKYLTGITSGQGPDIGYMYVEMMNDFIDMGAIAPIDEYITPEERANYIYIDNGMIQGKQYALPLIVGNPRILLCNMEILGKSGFDTPPQTWDELVECTTKIAAEQPDVYAFPMGWGEPSVGALNNLFYPFLWQAGGDIFDESGKLALDSAEAVKAAQFIYDLRYKHKVVSESCTSLTDGQLKDAFVNGKAATYITGSGIANMLKDAPFEWDYTTSLRDKTTGTFAASDSLVLLDSCKNKELATKLMKYITSAPTMESLHTKLRSGPPLTKDAKYCDLEKYERMYAKDTGSFHTLPVASGMPKVYDTLYKNLQLMMLDELTPEQALKDTVDYAETVLEQ